MGQLRAVVALADQGLSPSIHVVTHKSLQLQFQGNQHPPLAFMGTSIHVVQRNTWRQNTHTHKMKIKTNTKKQR